MVVINCSSCKKQIEVKNKRFKLCSTCKKERSLKRARDWKKKNSQKDKEITRKWREEHKEETSEYNSKYNVENREEIQARQTKQHRERKEIDLNYKLATDYRSYLSNFMRSYQNESYHFKFKKDFLIKWFTFLNPKFIIQNYGVGGWNIDHIIPCSMFNLENENELKQCFHWSNLQPLKSIDNLKKGTKITKEEIDILESKLNQFINENDIKLPKFDRYKFLIK